MVIALVGGLIGGGPIGAVLAGAAHQGAGPMLVVVDLNAQAVFEISATGEATVLSDSALLTAPNGIARLPSGDYVVSNSRNGTPGSLLRVLEDGTTTAIVSGLPIYGAVGVAVDSVGDFIVGDRHCFVDSGINCTLMKITPGGTVTTVFSFPLSARPSGVAIDSSGNYIVTAQGEVWRITSSGDGTVVTSGAFGFGVTVDEDGNYLVAGNQSIFQVTPEGAVSTLHADDAWGRLIGITTDPGGNLVVTDEVNAAVYGINTAGQVKTLFSGSPLSSPGGAVALTSVGPFPTLTPVPSLTSWGLVATVVAMVAVLLWQRTRIRATNLRPSARD